jgi:hypothetical protein
MEPIGSEDVSAQGLARLLDLQMPLSWSTQDAAAALRHQLAAPAMPELERIPAMEATLQHFYKNNPLPAEERGRTFLDHLLRPAPDLAILELIKTFSRRVDEEEANPLRGIPARVLYFAAIAAALCGCDTKITQSKDEVLREGFFWCRGVAGAERLRELFEKANAHLHVT